MSIPFSLFRKYSDDVSERLAKIPVKNIRNFCIIAHVDHGKSTLADRLLENTGAVTTVKRAQMLDNLKVEQDRGITVKAQTATLFYKHPVQKEEYLLNLIDTPGHVDFCNEVYRSLAAADGAILLVDANHGIQAQTVSNYHLAKSKNLKIIPVLNKIDLRNANPKKVAEDLVKMFGFDEKEILKISAKMGIGVDQIIPEIIKRIPPPVVDSSSAFRALIFDGWYDRYRGALSLIYVKGGELLPGQEVVVNTTNKSFEVKSVSLLAPSEVTIKKL